MPKTSDTMAEQILGALSFAAQLEAFGLPAEGVADYLHRQLEEIKEGRTKP